MMTKFLKILTIGIIGISLMACAGKKETVTECISAEKNSQKMMIQQTSTLEAKGDELLKESHVLSYTYQLDKEDDKKVVEEQLEEFGKFLKEHTEKTYGSLKGVTFEITKKDLNTTLLLTFDYEQADLQELADADVIESYTSGVDFMSLKITKEALEKENYTCTVK